MNAWKTAYVLAALLPPALWAQAPQQPDTDGVFTPDTNVRMAKLVGPVGALVPAEADLAGKAHLSTFKIVISADGTPTFPHHEEPLNDPYRKNPLDDPYDKAALNAVLASKYEPGTISGSPVPTWLTVYVPFNIGSHPAIPMLVPDIQIAWPTCISHAKAQYTTEAKNKKIEGTVVVRGEVELDGAISSFRVLKSLGYGLDEAAVESLRKAQCKPMMVFEVPLPMTITVNVNFHLY